MRYPARALAAVPFLNAAIELVGIDRSASHQRMIAHDKGV